VPLPTLRVAGVLIPLFSIRSESGWGLGELPDIGTLAPWLEQAGFSQLMLLPLQEVALGHTSPYSALSAFALDPVYIALDELEDFEDLGGEGTLPHEERQRLDEVRGSDRVLWGAVRGLKDASLRRCYAHCRHRVDRRSERAIDLERFAEEHRDWLFDYGLFRALTTNLRTWWRTWEPPLQNRRPEALADARNRYADDCGYYEYLQWLAYRQIAAAREEARHHGVQLAGDLPFMVAEDSADAWARQDEFRFDASVGVPPDDFAKDGQDWGLPVYRWDVLASRDYDWLRQRGEHLAEAFDVVRVDHVVGFYRTYVRPKNGAKPFFSPAVRAAQIAQGEAVVRMLEAGGAGVIAEDLGMVPPFVRQSLTRIGVPGFRVLRWEKDDEDYRDPSDWPGLSVATTGTHDTEPIATWWDAMPSHERHQLCRLPFLDRLAHEDFGPLVHQGLLETVYASGSRMLLLPIQDVFGSSERINLPGTVSSENWTYRLPWSTAELLVDSGPRPHTRMVAELALRYGRSPKSLPAHAPSP